MSEEDKTLILWHWQLELPLEWRASDTTWIKHGRDEGSPAEYPYVAFRIPPRE